MFSLGNFSIGTLVGLLIGALLGHALAIRRGKFQKKHEAAIAFKQEVIPALNALANGGSQFNIIQNSFNMHHEAALQYSAYLEWSDRELFFNDLKIYTEWRKELYGKDRVENLYDTNCSLYLRAKATDPVTLINKLLSHACT
jgi:hypothetical protein